MWAVKKKREVVEPKVKWWKLKELACQEEFREEVRKGLQGTAEILEDWETTAGMLRKVGEKVLGVTSEKWKNGKETWWWNDEVQESIKEKKKAKKTWDLLQDEVSRKNYKVVRKKTSRVVAKARADACEELYDKLKTREGERQIYRLAKQRDRAGRDVQQVRVIKDADGNVLTRTKAC